MLGRTPHPLECDGVLPIVRHPSPWGWRGVSDTGCLLQGPGELTTMVTYSETGPSQGPASQEVPRM